MFYDPRVNKASLANMYGPSSRLILTQVINAVHINCAFYLHCRINNSIQEADMRYVSCNWVFYSMKYTNVIIPLVIAVIASGGIKTFFLEGQNNSLRVVFQKDSPDSRKFSYFYN